MNPKLPLNLLAIALFLGAGFSAIQIAEPSKADSATCSTADDGDNTSYKLLGDTLFDYAGNSKLSGTTCAKQAKDITAPGFSRVVPGWYWQGIANGGSAPTRSGTELRFHQNNMVLLSQDFMEDAPNHQAWRGVQSVVFQATTNGATGAAALMDVQIILGVIGNPTFALTGAVATAQIPIPALGGNSGVFTVTRDQFTVVDSTSGTPLSQAEAQVFLIEGAVAQVNFILHDASSNGFKVKPTNVQVLTDVKVINPKEDQSSRPSATANTYRSVVYNDVSQDGVRQDWEEVLTMVNITKLGDVDRNPDTTDFFVQACAHLFLMDVQKIQGTANPLYSPAPKCLQQVLSVPTPGICSIDYVTRYEDTPGPDMTPQHPQFDFVIRAEGSDTNKDCDVTQTASLDAIPDSYEDDLQGAYEDALGLAGAIVETARACVQAENPTCASVINCLNEGGACSPVIKCANLEPGTPCKTAVDLVDYYVGVVGKLVGDCTSGNSTSPCKTFTDCKDLKPGSACYTAYMLAYECASLKPTSYCGYAYATIMTCIAGDTGTCKIVHDAVNQCVSDLGQDVTPTGGSSSSGPCGTAATLAGQVLATALACLNGQNTQGTNVCSTIKACIGDAAACSGAKKLFEDTCGSYNTNGCVQKVNALVDTVLKFVKDQDIPCRDDVDGCNPCANGQADCSPCDIDQDCVPPVCGGDVNDCVPPVCEGNVKECVPDPCDRNSQICNLDYMELVQNIIRTVTELCGGQAMSSGSRAAGNDCVPPIEVPEVELGDIEYPEVPEKPNIRAIQEATKKLLGDGVNL